MSEYKNFLAFDLGASNGRAILGLFENHHIEMNGVFYWDTPYVFDSLKQGLLAFR